MIDIDKINLIKRKSNLGIPKWTIGSNKMWMYGGGAPLYFSTGTSLIGMSSSPNFDEVANFYNTAQEDMMYLIQCIESGENKNDRVPRRWAVRLVGRSKRSSNPC
jgi:hypothetical protein